MPATMISSSICGWGRFPAEGKYTFLRLESFCSTGGKKPFLPWKKGEGCAPCSPSLGESSRRRGEHTADSWCIGLHIWRKLTKIAL